MADIELVVKNEFNTDTKVLHTGGKANHCPPGGFGKFIFANLEKYANKNNLAQINGHTGEEECYRSFLNKCIALALYLQDQGIQEGDVISMCSENTMQNCAVLVASFLIGAITASTDPLQPEDDTQSLLEAVDPKLIFVCPAAYKLIINVNKVMKKKIKMVALYDYPDLDNLPNILGNYSLEKINAFEPVHINDNNTTACILFSSGTSGMPKPTCVTHHGLVGDLAVANLYVEKFQMQTGRALFFPSLYWISGVIVTIDIFCLGLTRVVIRKFEPTTIWDDVEKFKISVLFLTYATGMQCLPYLSHSLRHLVYVNIGGGSLPSARFQEFKSKLPHVVIGTGYGLTEIGDVGICFDITDGKFAYTLSQKDIYVKIVEPDTETALDLNNTGEIRVKGFGHSTGYLNDTAEAWDKDGFFKTGDLGYIDDTHRLHIVDRLKEIFRYRVWRLAPAKIEKVLLEHPAVAHGIVIGLPDEIDHLPLGVVVLRKGMSATSDELESFVNDKIDEMHKLRAGIVFISEEEIPFTPSGKISRFKLKHMIINKLKQTDK